MAASDNRAEDAPASPSTATERSGEPDFSKRHPLENAWTLWFDPGQSGRQNNATWGGTLRSVYTFDTVEDFWSLYNNIATPSRLTHGMNIHMFKKGIEPKWEDPACASGGGWKVPIKKGSSDNMQLDTMWLHSLLACIGEQFDESEEVCGVVCNVRKSGSRVEMWTRTASNEAAQMGIARQLKALLDLDEQIKFMAHSDAKAGSKTDRYKL